MNNEIDLLANGKLIAKGELVEIDGRLGHSHP
ncbi:MAG: FliM/FliN family flagellar motor switch protein [bacterium]